MKVRHDQAAIEAHETEQLGNQTSPFYFGRNRQMTTRMMHTHTDTTKTGTGTLPGISAILIF